MPQKTTRSLKVPSITVLFWAIKLCTTALGESFSDYLVYRINPVVAVGAAAVIMAGLLVVQVRLKRYHPTAYWATVLMVAVFGTMAADVLHVGLGVPYFVSTGLFGAGLALIFLAWRWRERTLSIHSVVSVRREVFYWLTVLATFALGTAAGDLTAVSLGLGYAGSIVLFGVLILLPLLGRLKFRLSEVGMFWTAYILTRPLGASIADWVGKPVQASGLGFGDGWTSVMLFGLFVVGVTLVSQARRRQATLR